MCNNYSDIYSSFLLNNSCTCPVFFTFLLFLCWLIFQGVQEKVNLTSPLLSKDDPIFDSLSHKLGHRMDEVGHRIHYGLLRVRMWWNNNKADVFLLSFIFCCIYFSLFFHAQNSSSWVLYNLASFYWRMKNEPRRAVDCVIRALHFSPR